jgi:hypothetical protein
MTLGCEEFCDRADVKSFFQKRSSKYLHLTVTEKKKAHHFAVIAVHHQRKIWVYDSNKLTTRQARLGTCRVEDDDEKNKK